MSKAKVTFSLTFAVQTLLLWLVLKADIRSGAPAGSDSLMPSLVYAVPFVGYLVAFHSMGFFAKTSPLWRTICASLLSVMLTTFTTGAVLLLLVLSGAVEMRPG